jgi:hypothetical protein
LFDGIAAIECRSVINQSRVRNVSSCRCVTYVCGYTDLVPDPTFKVKRSFSIFIRLFARNWDDWRSIPFSANCASGAILNLECTRNLEAGHPVVRNTSGAQRHRAQRSGAGGDGLERREHEYIDLSNPRQFNWGELKAPFDGEHV